MVFIAELVVGSIVVIDIVLRVVAIGFIPENRRPSSGMAWLILILTLPIPGFLVFWLFGRTQVGKERHERQKEANILIGARAADLPDLSLDAAPPYLGTVMHLNRRLGALPAVQGNSAQLFADYSTSINAMAAVVDQATEWVHVEFYITAWDEVTKPFFDALVAATERGVPVRLLFDHIGSRGIPGYKEMLTSLDATKIEYHPMLPFRPLHGQVRRPDLRNHRKILVVDGLVAFAGSQNMIEPGYNKPKNHKAGRTWVELTTRVEGPLVVSLNAVFATDWYAETGEILTKEVERRPVVVPTTGPALGGPADKDADPAGRVAGQVVPSGPGFVQENNLRFFNSLIYGAQHRISLTSPYFVPDESLLYAVTTAAQRGLDVELFVCEEGDQFMVHHAQRSYYQALLESGVRIWLYRPPFVLHSKHFSVDEDVVVLGSSNMDMRSFALNFEVSVMLTGGDVVRQMREVEDAYRAMSRQLTLEEWKQRPLRSRYVDNAMRLTAALQ